MMPQQAKPFDWRTAIKSWNAASAQRKAQQPKKTQNMEMILAATKTLKILDGRITQHINALNTVWQKHRMTPNSQDIMTAVMKLQEDLTKLYKTREALQKHKLSVADQVVKFDSVLNKTDPVPTPNEAETPLPVDPVIDKKEDVAAAPPVDIPTKIYKAASAAGLDWKKQNMT